LTRKRLGTSVQFAAGLLLVTATACGTVLLCGTAITGGYVSAFVDLIFKPVEQIPFDVAGWNAPMTGKDSIFTGTRLKMVDDLLRRYDFHGWTEQEVKDLLGEPERPWDDRRGHALRYNLREGLNLLIFQLDDQNRVVRYYVYKDD
jgi:hypothetical protein